MHHYKALQLAISIAIAVGFGFISAQDNPIIRPVTQLGRRSSPDSRFSAVLRQNSMGGGLDLFVMKRSEPIFYAADVTGYLWINDVLLYSSLPLYGTGGIYKYNAVDEIRSSVVDGKPNEYFELQSFSAQTRKLAYYYSNDIRDLDVARLKASKGAMREVTIPSQ